MNNYDSLAKIEKMFPFINPLIIKTFIRYISNNGLLDEFLSNCDKFSDQVAIYNEKWRKVRRDTINPCNIVNSAFPWSNTGESSKWQKISLEWNSFYLYKIPIVYK